MPSYSSHIRVYEIIGISAGYCAVIDRIIDEDPPLVRDVVPDVGCMEVLPRHFGYKDREFPYMAKFVLDRFGYERPRCLAAHFVLDHIEGLVARGFDSEMISNEVRHSWNPISGRLVPRGGWGFNQRLWRAISGMSYQLCRQGSAMW